MANNRSIRIFLLAVLVTGMALCAFAAGIGVTWLIMHDRSANAEEEAEFGVFWEAWHLVEDHFFGETPAMQQVAWGAIRGALETLDDRHTTFLEPTPRQREKEDLSGRFGGIGAYVSQAEDGSIVLDPMPDLPAEQAGILEGDVVIQIDGTEITPEMSVDEVVTLVRGEIGTRVTLTLRREGQAEPVVIEIQRQEIPSPSVQWEMMEGTENVGYIRISLFSGRTAKELDEAIKSLKEQGMNRLIVDLRGNGGGLFDAAIDVASAFLDGDVVLYQVEREQDEKSFSANRGGEYTEAPLVLLVDGGTASASEIVAGALQDRDRAALVGQKTYGKGSVQSVYDLSDGSSVHITSAKWLTPSRRLIDGQGLEPDIVVEFTDQDREAGLDPQLERALETLQAGR
ncbi:MAG: S41 family peptidase [Anaerolineae bacterium]|jgi:carboxyl-terminal processing protease